MIIDGALQYIFVNIAKILTIKSAKTLQFKSAEIMGVISLHNLGLQCAKKLIVKFATIVWSIHVL